MPVVPIQIGQVIASYARDHGERSENDTQYIRDLAQSLRDVNQDSTDPFDDAQAFKGGGGGKGGGSGGGNSKGGKNFDPVARDVEGATSEEDTLTVDLLSGASDKNNDPLAVTHINGQAVAYNAWITLASGASYYLDSTGLLTYDPAGAYDALNDGEVATETLAYTISDDRGGTSDATISIDIAGVSDAATPQIDAVDDHFEALASEVTELALLENDVDGLGAGLSIIAINGQEILPGSHIHLASGAEVDVHADGTISYDPTGTSSFAAGTTEDSFSYTVQDAEGNTDTAIASIDVINDPADPPPPDPEPEPTDVPFHAILAGDSFRLNAGDPYGTPDTVTFAFLDEVPFYYPSSSYVHDSFQSFTDQQRDATREILAQVESFSGLTFVEVAPEDAEMVFGIADMAGDLLGSAFYPSGDGSGLYDSDVWIDTQTAGTTFEPGTLGHAILAHETGHALGLSHPSSEMPTWIEATRQFTVMGHGEHPGAVEDASSFMSYDIAALQHLYGTNDTATAGDDTYDVSDDVRSIWDAGGNDTLDFSGSSTEVIINLSEGAFSSSSGQENNLSIAYGTQIENAVGSDYDDEILGNDAGNILNGGMGSDTLTGGEGADLFSLSSHDGADVITDFDTSEDSLDLGGYSLADLMLDPVDGGLVLSHDAGWSVNLVGVSEISDSELFF